MDLYQEAILDELKQPQHKSVLADADVQVHETNASCGDEVTVFLKLSPDKKTITELTWQGSGCAISQAAMSLLAAELQGKVVAEVLSLQQADLEALLGLEQPIAYGRTKCLLLGLKATKAAVQQLKD